jgi:TfoX/Sxy family transcriptional regulator of competence genes
MNKRWHDQNRLSRSATLDERIAWHRAHQAECACRPIPAKLLERMTDAMPKAKSAGTKAAPAPTDVDPKFAAVVAAFAGDRHVTTGKMMASVGVKVNGKIFAMIVRGKLVAKLPRDRVDELVQSGVGEYFDPRRDGRLMKEWIQLRGTKPSWIELAKEAHRFVSGKKT